MPTMRLRTSLRPPGRYREEDYEELPPNPSFVVPTIPFNPNLRPAVFPTLQWDEMLPETPGEEGNERNSIGVGVERPARVFRDTRIVPVMEQEEGLQQLSDGRWLATEEPGEFDPYAVSFSDDDDENEPQERWFLPSLNEKKYWSDLSNAMRLVIIRELTDQMHFEDAILFLQLEEQELEAFLNLCADEVNIRVVAQERDARIVARQMALVDDGDDDAWGRIYDEALARGDARMPATFLISREDVVIAKTFLGNYRFREEFSQDPGLDIDQFGKIPAFEVLMAIQDRLELYIGVSTTFEAMDLGVDMKEYIPQDILAAEVVGDEDVEDFEKILERHQPQTISASRVMAEAPPASPKPPPTATFTTMRPSLKRSPTKRSPKKNIERDGIENELIRKRGRPKRTDKIVKGPSRLSQVTNIDDLSPNVSPKEKDSDGRLIDTPARPVTPRSVQNLARSPFQEYSSASPPPKHSASFRNDLPAQPASTSPPKDPARSESLGLEHALGLGIAFSSIVQASLEAQDDPIIQADRIPQPTPKEYVTAAEATPIIQNCQISQIIPDFQGPQDAPVAHDVPISQEVQNDQGTLVVQPISNPTVCKPSMSGTAQPSILASAPAKVPSNNQSITPPAKSQSDLVQASDTEYAPNRGKVVHPPPRPGGASKKIRPPPRPSKPNITPTKTRLKAKGAQNSAPAPSSNAPFSTPQSKLSVAAIQGKRTNDEIAGGQEEKAAKKARLEQQPPQTGIVSSIVDQTKKIGQGAKKIFMGPFQKGSDAGSKLHDSPNSSSTGKDSDTASIMSPDPAMMPNIPEAVNHLDGATKSGLKKVPLPNSADLVKGSGGATMETRPKLPDPVAVPNPSGVVNFSEPHNPNRNFDFIQYSPNKSRPSSPSRPGQASVCQTEANPNVPGSVSDMDPQTRTKSSECDPNPPKKPRKESLSKAESAKVAGKALEQELNADESKKLGAPPLIIEEKTRSAARHARTTSQSSTESLDILGSTSPKHVDDPGMSRLRPGKTTIEVQIRAQKRAASEVTLGSSERSGSPPRILRSGEHPKDIKDRTNSDTESVAGFTNTSSISDAPAQRKGGKQKATTAKKTDSQPKAPAKATALKSTIAKGKAMKGQKKSAAREGNDDGVD